MQTYTFLETICYKQSEINASDLPDTCLEAILDYKKRSVQIIDFFLISRHAGYMLYYFN